MFRRLQCMQRQLPLKTRHNPTQNECLGDDFTPIAIETYSCLHPCFDSFFISYVHACIACHQQTSLVLWMLIFHYRQQVLRALQCVQALAILQWAATLNHDSLSLPHILASAPPSLVDLWHRRPF